mmetsp:Transcript_30535/g.72035  ORF Transcript_30535/g.72035 Transcript_30535/m.72035 type:complete len:389 (+) Transcript_30535:91-1257(+)
MTMKMQWAWKFLASLIVLENLPSEQCKWLCSAFTGSPSTEGKYGAFSLEPRARILSSKTNPDHFDGLELESSIIEELASFANDLANAAGDAIMPFWRRKGVRVETKFDQGRSISQTVSPVTIADRSAEEAMRNLIEDRYPSHGIYGEEYGQIRTDADFVWVLDPIDGTKAFITGKPTWGTLIGCLHRGVPIVGVIDHCVLQERWVGSIGNPTRLNGEPVSVAETSARTLCDATLYTTTPDMFRAGEEMEKFEAVRDASLRTLYGCDCYAYALVASGFGADAVVEADLGLYDYAAIVPVMQSAGGIITDWDGNALTLKNHDNSKGRVVASSNTALHDEMLRALSSTPSTAQPLGGQHTIEKELSGGGIFRQTFAFVSGVLLGIIGRFAK